MKKNLLIIACLFIINSSFSANYYISSSSGNDTYSGINQLTPWKTLTKLNSKTFSAGDSILFKRGDVFYGALNSQSSAFYILSVNGTAAKPIVISAYGSGSMPVIRASEKVTGWTLYQPNIWKANLPNRKRRINLNSSSVLASYRIPFLFVDNVMQQIGREPNFNPTDGGFRTIASHNANMSITEASSLPYPDNTFKDAEFVFRAAPWMIRYKAVLSHTGNTVNVSATSYTFRDQYGYFFQNHIKTLDREREWYNDTTNNALYIYSSVNPNTLNIEVPLLEKSVFISKCSYIKILSLRMENAGVTTLETSGSYLTIDGCYLNNNSLNGVNAYGITKSKFTNNIINQSNTVGLRLSNCNGITVAHNVVKNAGLWAGMSGGVQDPVLQGISVYNNGAGTDTTFIEQNLVDSVGYVGINYEAKLVVVRRNEIRNFCMVVDDGGGIYVGGMNDPCSVYENFVHDSKGAPLGKDKKVSGAKGIYLDNASFLQNVYRNSIYNIDGTCGLMIHDSGNSGGQAFPNNIYENTMFNCSVGFEFVTDTNTWGPGPNGKKTTLAEYNNTYRNIFFARDASQYCTGFLFYSTFTNDYKNKLGLYDSNYYCQPYPCGKEMFISKTDYKFANYKTTFPLYEQHGVGPPVRLNCADDPNTYIRFETNISASTITVNLGSAKYVDPKGVYYTGIISLKPWSSLGLIKIADPLPVSWMDFTATPLSDKVNLKWSTATEQNNLKYVIERSSNGSVFEKTDSVDAGLTSSNVHYYTFDDRNPLPGISYYRLQQVDVDSAYSYSKTVRVSYDQFSKIQLYPNPTTGQLQISINGLPDEAFRLIVSDSDGRILFDRQGNTGTSLQTYEWVDLSNAPAGLYCLRFSSNNHAETLKVEKW